MPFDPGARFVRVLAVLILLCSFVSRAGAACSGFGAGAAFAAGSSPQAAAVGDFDGDGVQDLAVACLSGAALEVLRGTGAGSFAAPVAYASGASGRAVAVSDFDRDGRADVAVAVATGVATWRGDGHGAFTGGAITVAGSANRGIVCADFGGDGIVDVALASSGTNAVLVMRGRGADGVGDGTFDAPVTYAVGTSPARLLASDLDGDGVLDLVVSNNGGASVSVLRGLAAGAFAPATTIALTGSPWGVATLDFNRDGVADLVVSDGAGTTLTLLRGTGACAFTNAGTVAVPTAPRDLVAGDFDGDGLIDVAAACAAGNRLALVHGTGAGLALLASFTAPSGAAGLAGGDFDGDGIADVASVNTGANSVMRFLGTCPAAPGASVTLLAPLGGETWWPGSAQQVRWSRGDGVAAVDVDLSRDGGVSWTPLARGATGNRLDVPTVGAPSPSLRARVRDALVPSRAAASPGDFTLCGLFAAPIASDAGVIASAWASADLDGDGALDLVLADASHVAVLRGDGTGHFAPGASRTASGTRRVRVADVTGDGLADLVRVSDAGLGVSRGDGAGAFGAESTLVLAGVSDALALDLDGDGIADVAALAANGADARLVVWRSRTSTSPWVQSFVGAPGPLASADFDGDGVPDLALGAGASAQLLYGNASAGRGDGTFRAGPSRTLPSAAGELAAGDLDGDGTPDLVATLPASGDLALIDATAPLASAASGSLATPQVVAIGGTPRTPRLADLDGDGRADLALARGGASSLDVLRGSASGLGSPASFAASSCGALVAIDDVTRDGNPDAIVAAPDGRVLVLPAQCPPQVASTLALTDPADTSAALAGFARTLAWTRSASVGAVRVELSRDGGAHWVPLADGVGANTFTWIASGAPTADARLRVVDAACGTRWDASARFSIRDAFAGGTSSAALTSARLLACDDVNADDAPDAIVADGVRVQVLRGDGAGGFTEAARWSETNVRRAAVRDVDGDGVADLLTLRGGMLATRLGSGDGAFALARERFLDAGATDLALGDFDEDGVPDLAIACADGNVNRVSVRRGLSTRGNADFGDPAYVALAAAPTALAAFDVDDDGVLDLVVAHGTNLAVLRGQGAGGRGNGTFRLASQRGFGAGDVRALLLADLDGDGRTDVAAADSAMGAVLVAAGDGAGGFASPVAIAMPAAPRAIARADVDHDGALDLVVTLADGTLALLRGVAAAPMASRFALVSRTSGAAGTLALADADADGVADAIALDPAGVLRVVFGAGARADSPSLVAPAGGSLTAGTEASLAWTRPAGVAAVDVELSRDGGERWTPIARGLSATTWRWTVTGPYTGAARLRVRDAEVASHHDAGASLTIEPATTSAPAGDVPMLRLGAPSPNPASGTVSFALELPAPARVRAEVCDAAGRRVRALVDAEVGAGAWTLRWDGADARGFVASPGVYFVRVRAAGMDVVRRVVRR